MAYFDGLTTAQVAALSTADIAALTTADLSSITTTQISALTTTQIVALTTTNIQGIPSAAIPFLTTTQVAAIEPADIAALTTSQFGAFQTADLAVLSTAQISSIEPADLGALGTYQIAAFSTAQLSVLSASQVAGIADLDTGYNTSSVVSYGNNPTFLVSPPNGAPIAIPTGTTWDSGVMSMRDFNSVVVGILADRILTVTVQRYIDPAGTLPVGAAGTLTSTANTAGYTSALSANVPATHFKVTVANASGSTAIVSKFAIAVQSF